MNLDGNKAGPIDGDSVEFVITIRTPIPMAFNQGATGGTPSGSITRTYTLQIVATAAARLTMPDSVYEQITSFANLDEADDDNTVYSGTSDNSHTVPYQYVSLNTSPYVSNSANNAYNVKSYAPAAGCGVIGSNPN